MNKNKGLGLVSVQIKNIGPIKEVVCELQPGVNVFQGDNGVGKSSILNSLDMAFKGKKAIPANIIRHGTDENGFAHRGEIVVETTGFTAKLELSKGLNGEQKHKLSVTRDGSGLMKPATFLENLSAVWNDPQELARMKEKELYDILVQYAKINLEEYDQQIETVKDNQKVLRAQKKELGILSPVPEVKKISAQDLLNKIQEMNDFNGIQKENTEIISRYEKAHKEKESEINELKKKLALLIAKKSKIAIDLNKAVRPLPLKDTEPVKEKIATIEVQNEKADKYLKFIEWQKKVKKIDISMENNKDKIATTQNDKKQAVVTAKMPVEGLAITEEKTVTYSGDNWETCCESDRLLIAARLIVNTTPENAVRWMMIHTGEGILSKRRELLHEYLVTNNYTCLMQVASEEIPDNNPGTFYISEGVIK